MEVEIPKKKRLLALDVMRGITIAGMILVNNPGSDTVFTPLEHAKWIGLTPTDLVFPFFMFMMGITTYLSLSKYHFEFSRRAGLKILKRTALIWLIGLAVSWIFMFTRGWMDPANASLSFFDRFGVSCNTLDRIRILGVMPRLAICYGLSAIIALTVRHKYIPWLIVVLFIGYFIILLTGNGFAYDHTNILYRFDVAVMGENHIYRGDILDPEGILSTIPALGHVLIGFCVGKIMMQVQDLNDKLERLFIIGVLLTFSGLLLSYGCPLSKKLWTPTFALTTCGLASSLLAILIWCIDKKGYVNFGTRFFESFGVNPLFLYVLADLLILPFSVFHLFSGQYLTIQSALYNLALMPLLGAKGGALAYALIFVGINWCIGNILYKKKIYIKL
jgi:predicted acyltransferase